MKGFTNSKQIYNFNELQGKLTSNQVQSIDATSITGVLATQNGGTGTNKKGIYALESLGISNPESITLFVAKDGSEQFTTITAALGALPKLLNYDAKIIVHPGTYVENILITGFYGKGILTITTNYADGADATAKGNTIIDGSITLEDNTAYISIGGNIAPNATYPTPFFRVTRTDASSVSGSAALISTANCTRVYIQNMHILGNKVVNLGAYQDSGNPKLYGVRGTYNSYIYVTRCKLDALYATVYSTYGSDITVSNCVGSSTTGTGAVTSTNSQNKYSLMANYGGRLIAVKGAIPGCQYGTKIYAGSSGGHVTGTGTVTTKFT